VARALLKVVPRGASGNPFAQSANKKIKFFTFIFQLSGLALIVLFTALLTVEYAERDRAQSEGQQRFQAL